jgi:hypothetical protein
MIKKFKYKNHREVHVCYTYIFNVPKNFPPGSKLPCQLESWNDIDIGISILGKNDWHYNPLWRHGHIKFFSVKTLTKILESSNFKIISKNFSGRFYPINCSMIFLNKKN